MKKGALARMRARIGAVGDAVAVHIDVAAELAAGVELFRRQHLAAVEGAAVVPGERLHQPLVHADVEVEHDEDRGLQAVGEIEGEGPELEALARVLGEEEDVLGVAVGGIGGDKDVRLLGARRHAGRGTAALDVEDDRGDFREIGEADEFLHQRDARPAVAVKARAPFQAAPMTMPIEASSSSAWTMA